MANQDRRPNDLGENLREGVRTVAGILGALKDAVEESFDELRQRGDLSPERAREAARSTVQRAQEEMEGMRDRFDFATRRDVESLRAEIETLRAELGALRARLEVHVHATGHTGSGAGAGPEGSAAPHPPYTRPGSGTPHPQGPGGTQATDPVPPHEQPSGGTDRSGEGGSSSGFPVDGG